MSDSNGREILDLLMAYQAGQIYTIAPKQYVLRGFDYYRRGSLRQLEWNKDFSVLSAKVRGTRIYSVDFSMNGQGLSFHCNCPAWSPHSNCKHVICSLVTLKNLLQPETFSRGFRQDEEHRDYLLQCLHNQPVAALPVKEKPSGYSVVIEHKNRFTDVFIRRDGGIISEFSPGIPPELRRLTGRSYYTGYAKLMDFSRYLQKAGNKYPFILKTRKEETAYAFDTKGAYSCGTEIDAAGDSVKISKVSFCDDSVIQNPLFAEDFIFDRDAKKFSIIKSRIGWMYWNDILETFYNDPFSDVIPDSDNASFIIPLETFQKSSIVYRSPEGDMPEHLLLKINGAEAKPYVPDTRYRLTAAPSGDEHFLIKAECVLSIDNITSSTSTLFNFFSLTEKGLNPSLRAKKRRSALLRAFLDMATADSKANAEGVIKQTLSSGDFHTYKLKHDARSVLKDHLYRFFIDENELLLRNGKWVSVKVDKKRELQLYRIPFELFGWTIFQNTPAYNQMIVKSGDLYEKLPLLYERAKEKNIELLLDNLPVKPSHWEFSFDASRPEGIDWFEIRPEIRCNGELIGDRSFYEMLQGKGSVVKDGCIRIMDQASKQILEVISTIYRTGGIPKETKNEIVKVPKLRILDWITLRSSGVKIKLPPEDEQIIERLTSFERIEPKPLPSILKAKLRQYQKDGYAWLSFLYESRFGACLADDMGLGKTVQAISLLAGIKQGIVRHPGKDIAGPHLIVLPPSLLFNWENEIKRFCPNLKMLFYTGKERSCKFDGFDAVLTTYGLVRRDLDKLKDMTFDVIIFDEAQAIKNIYADTTGAVRQLKARFKLAMTGTPLENHIGEYYSIIDLAMPGLLGDFEDFRPLIKQEVSPSLDMIIRRTRPFVLRRTKETILKELPPKVETDIYLDLTERQKALYKKTVEQVRAAIDTAYSTKTTGQAQIIALTAILKLRQLCVSPQLIAPELKDPSPKIDFLIGNLQELLKENHSVLVFSQFTSFLDILEKDLIRNEIDFIRLDGSTPVIKRKKLIEEFQSSEGPCIFLLSLKAGGQGLNLTKASYVFHLDPWWNPAVENQASDRAHRIGQKKKVTITRILMRHTIEEKMMVLKKKKLELYKAVMEDTPVNKKGLSITKSDFNFLLG